jgi:Domain of unknown function (DUF4279)
MACLHRTVASLRIRGDALDPDEISKILCCLPTKGFRKGQVVRGARSGFDHTKKIGMWSLQAEDRQPGNLDEQISGLLDRLPKDLAIWRGLSARFEIDLFCGFFMKETDEGLEISSQSLRLLGDRSITLGFCIYAPLGDEEETKSEEPANFPESEASPKS